MSTILVGTYAPAFSAPDLIERAKAQRLSLPVYYDGALVVPSSAVLSLYDPSNVAVLDSVACTIASGTAVYDLLAASVPATYAPSQRWREEWTLTMTDGQVHTFRRDAHLCLRRLYPVIGSGDLVARHHDAATLIRRGKSLQGYVDGAWDTVIYRLLGDSRYPQQVMTPWGLREAHLALSLHRLFLDAMLNVAGEDKYSKLADYYGEEYKQAWAGLRFTVDLDEDNKAPSDDETMQGAPVIMLGGAPSAYERLR